MDFEPVNKTLTEKVQETRNQVQKFAEKATDKIVNVSRAATIAMQDELMKTDNKVRNVAEKSNVFQMAKKSAGDFSLFARDFSEKNSTVSKFVFILFIFILFGLLIRLGMYLLSGFFAPKKNPVVVDGMLHTTSLTQYQVNPSHANSKPILRSINENQGMEFTWNTWIYIDNPVTGSSSTPKRFFSKGGDSLTGDPFEMNAPGLYLWDPSDASSHINTLTIAMTKYDNNDNNEVEKISIRNIPIQKWVNITIRAQNRTIDVYVNGVLSKRVNLSEVIKQNHGNIYVGDSGSGPVGFISALRYYSYAIGNNEIQSIIEKGPNLKIMGNSHQETAPPYLASRWYIDNII
jgi:hypothetical protein